MQKETSMYGFESIYRPETIKLIESTGLNTNPEELSELADAMNDTAGQAIHTMDGPWNITQILTGAVKHDEALYVEDARRKYAERLSVETGERKRWHYYDRNYCASLDQEEKTALQKAQGINDARVWHLAGDERAWKTAHQLRIAEDLTAALSKQELYLVLELSNHVNSPSYGRGSFSDVILELHQRLSKADFQNLCQGLSRGLSRDGKFINEQADAKFHLIWELRSEISENFKLAELVLKQDINKVDLGWISRGKKFYKNNERAFEAFFMNMKGIVRTHESNGYLGKYANLLLYWLPIGGPNGENLEELKELLPRLHYLRSDYSSNCGEEIVADLATDPLAFEKLKLALDFLTANIKDRGPHEKSWGADESFLLEQLKVRSIPECESLFTWAKENLDEYRCILGHTGHFVLRCLLAQPRQMTREYLEAWTAEFIKIRDLLATEFKQYKINLRFGKTTELINTSESDLTEMSNPILNYAFDGKAEDVMRIIEAYREIQRAQQPDITNEEWGNIKAWMETPLLWKLSPEQLEEVKAAYKELPADKLDVIVDKVPYSRDVYQGDYRKLIRCVQILAKHSTTTIGEGVSFNSLRETYGEDFEKMDRVFNILDKAVGENANAILSNLSQLKLLYGNDEKQLEACLDVLIKYPFEIIHNGCNLSGLNDLYETTEQMDQVFNVLSGVGGENPRAILEGLSALRRMYGKNLDKVSEVLAALNSFVSPGYTYESLEGKLQTVNSLMDFYGEDTQKLKEMTEVLNGVEEWPAELEDALCILREIYRGETSIVKRVAEMLVKYKKAHADSSLREFANKFCQFKVVIQEDPNKIEFIQFYLDQSPIVDQKTVEKFVQICEAEGEGKAREYLDGVKAKAKGMIGSQIPEEQRGMDEYKFLVQHVYPKGNYSDHEKNLACGDQLQHLERYTFDRAGYPVVLSGLNGYGLKNGEKGNAPLLSSYCERLQKMREFVSSRGPDSNALQEAYDKKIDGIFEAKAQPAFREIPGLSTKEKLFCLIVSEALRKAKEMGLGGARTIRTDETKVFTPDEELLDLVVEYKYAYHEDLEAYVLRSADDAKQYGDSVSQNYILWAELSVIYGENMKHVVRNDILGKISDEPHFRIIVDAYVNTISELTIDDDALPKARERVNATLANDRIPVDRKSEVMWKQLWTLFSSNLKFADSEHMKQFETKLREAAALFLQDPSLVNLELVLPKLLGVRNERRFDIGAKVEDLLSRDIGLIFKELAKYEELAEVEAKETSMNGPKDKIVKKSSKKRNIRGYITKTQESANARMGAYLCIAGDTGMWKDSNYLELVLEDEGTNRCVGVVMMLQIDATDGKKYLWFGPNPFESFLTQVSAKKTYDYMYKMVCNFAEENGFDGVVIPSNEGSILGACTNRGGEFPGLIKASRLRDEKRNIKIVQFGREHKLGGDYGYKDGALVWERKASEASLVAPHSP